MGNADDGRSGRSSGTRRWDWDGRGRWDGTADQQASRTRQIATVRTLFVLTATDTSEAVAGHWRGPPTDTSEERSVLMEAIAAVQEASQILTEVIMINPMTALSMGMGSSMGTGPGPDEESETGDAAAEEES